MKCSDPNSSSIKMINMFKFLLSSYYLEGVLTWANTKIESSVVTAFWPLQVYPLQAAF